VSAFEQIVAPMQDEFPWGDLLAAQQPPAPEWAASDSLGAVLSLVEETREMLWEAMEDMGLLGPYENWNGDDYEED
jgi:hypothetical protein